MLNWKWKFKNLFLPEFVSSHPPLATSVWSYVSRRRSAFAAIVFDNVKTEDLNRIHKPALQILNQVIEKGFDLQQLRSNLWQFVSHSIFLISVSLFNYLMLGKGPWRG